MEKEKINIELKINGQKVITGYFLDSIIINSIPDGEENRDIFDILAEVRSPYIKEFLSDKTSLSKKAINILLHDDDPEVVITTLIYSSEQIEEDMLLDILKLNSIVYDTTILQYLDTFTKCDKNKLLKIFENHEEACIRAMLLSYGRMHEATTETLEHLAKDKDIGIAYNAKKQLKNRKKFSSEI